MGAYTSRGYMRYDPHTRRYTNWYRAHDWNGNGRGDDNGALYPRFTEAEGRRILQKRNKGSSIDAAKMGKDWNNEGPNVCTHLNDPSPMRYLILS